MKIIIILTTLYIVMILTCMVLSIYEIEKISPQCQIEYENYLYYMDSINDIADKNDLDAVIPISISEFCKKQEIK